MKSVKARLRVISIVMSVVMIFMAANIQPALATGKSQDKVSDQKEKQEVVMKKPEKVKEIKSKRDKFSKVYLMSDGTFKYVSSAEAVHQKVDGEWVEINNKVSETTNSDGSKTYIKDNKK